MDIRRSPLLGAEAVRHNEIQQNVATPMYGQLSHTMGPGMHGEDPGTGTGRLLNILVGDAKAGMESCDMFLSGA
jgi:hypothetical protein